MGGSITATSHINGWTYASTASLDKWAQSPSLPVKTPGHQTGLNTASKADRFEERGYTTKVIYSNTDGCCDDKTQQLGTGGACSGRGQRERVWCKQCVEL